MKYKLTLITLLPFTMILFVYIHCLLAEKIFNIVALENFNIFVSKFIILPYAFILLWYLIIMLVLELRSD